MVGLSDDLRRHHYCGLTRDTILNDNLIRQGLGIYDFNRKSSRRLVADKYPDNHEFVKVEGDRGWRGHDAGCMLAPERFPLRLSLHDNCPKGVHAAGKS